jgi:hypothetical protein
LLTLASSQPNQSLNLYVSASHIAMSGSLVQEREIFKEKKNLSHQVHVYFISDAPVGSKKYYSEMEKICYAVVMSVGKLCHNFEARRVRVLTN